MTLQLRPARVTDLPAIYRGEERYMREWEPDHEASWRLHLEQNLKQWVDNFDRLTVAVVNDHFAGYALWTPGSPYAELCTIHVAPDYRRSGVGMALLQAYLLGAIREGFARLRLSVRSDNPARFMYEKAGFVCIGTGANEYLRYERHS